MDVITRAHASDKLPYGSIKMVRDISLPPTKYMYNCSFVMLQIINMVIFILKYILLL